MQDPRAFFITKFDLELLTCAQFMFRSINGIVKPDRQARIGIKYCLWTTRKTSRFGR